MILIDVTTGDAITPKEISIKVQRAFSEEKLELLSYPLETIMSKKLETILSRGIATTRPRDLYDVYTLSKLKGEYINNSTLLIALKNTMKKRNSKFVISDYPNIIALIRNSEIQQQL